MISTDQAGEPANPRSAALLSATGLTRSYDGVHALAGVDVAIRAGGIAGLIGPNGAGKTTLINLLSGFDLPSAGTVIFDGHDITRWSPQRRAAIGVARTFQHGRLFADLSMRENIELAALGVGRRASAARRLADELLTAFDLTAREEVVAAALSHGEQQKVGIARALACSPRFVLLDEPAAGLSEADIESFVEVLERVRSVYGACVLIVEHNVPLIMRVCDEIYVLDGGRLLARGTPAEIRDNVDVTAAYLGSSGVGSANAATSER